MWLRQSGRSSTGTPGEGRLGHWNSPPVRRGRVNVSTAAITGGVHSACCVTADLPGDEVRASCRSEGLVLVSDSRGAMADDARLR
jgi:hypothetical protein